MLVPPVPRRLMLAAALGATPAAASPLLEPRLRLRSQAVALTLDLCPGGFDARLAGFLAAERIPVTVFVTGEWLRRNPEGLAFLLAHPALFDLQNHGDHHLAAVLGGGWVHGLPLAGDPARLRAEVMGAAALLTAASGRAPRWFRGAGALYDQAALDLLRGLGVAIGGYSLSADLGASLGAEAVAARLAALGPGGVALAHLNQPRRAAGEGVMAGVARLRAAGATFVTLGGLEPERDCAWE
jgi:peptidoglycan/xylan/chitin deacetylase (PgdA/CDA1 family)